MARKRRYAEGTSVSPARSQAEIEKLIGRIDGDNFTTTNGSQHIMVAFEAYNRTVRIVLDMPDDRDTTRRMIWRHMVLYVKARVTEIQEGILDFDSAFLPHLMLPDGGVFGDVARPALRQAFAGRPLPSLIPGGGPLPLGPGGSDER